ncbi:MAG: DNA polymerase III subunit beta [Deltaproteobacteria bacterium]|nr:DNA polymerase III subunit beta [Deltaproteobacteria bacterium]
MRVKMERETLLKGIARTLGVVDRRGTMPILGNFLFQAEEAGVQIAATDLEVSFRGFYPAQVEEPGALTLPAHYCFNLIKELPGELLDLVGTEKSNLQLTVGESRYQLLGLPADQFPPVPKATDLNLVEVESVQLREMIEKTIFSVSVDDLQYHLSGIFWERLREGDEEGASTEEVAEETEAQETEEGEKGPYLLRMVSTDGHRLTLIQRPLAQSEHFAIEEGILIPRKGVTEISRMLAEEEKVALGLSQKSLALKVNDKYLFIRLLEKKFPDYRRIIPENFAYQFALSRRGLFDTLKRISLLSTERFKGVIIKLTAEMAEITFQNPEIGEGRELVPLTLEKGEAEGLQFEIGFNARYLLEPLSAMAGETVLLEVNERDRPCRVMEQNDPNYFSIIMPMSL